jgi:hypothetical protein
MAHLRGETLAAANNDALLKDLAPYEGQMSKLDQSVTN